ncbi:MAG: manganese efflux pump [Nanoarchaeota archaeon]
MNILTLALASLALNADVFAVSITAAAVGELPKRYAVRMAFIFALSHTIMLSLGWLIGSQLEHVIINYDHWVISSILVLVGLHMLWQQREKKTKSVDITHIFVLLLLGVVISLDALAVGIGLAFSTATLLSAALTLLVVTIIVSLVGSLVGTSIRSRIAPRAGIFGGLVLILLGLKILLEHTILTY